ncbi:MAG: ssb, partial [Proteobacteria bacterium]|nr:ssb [Pseudomonadota bacterium]
ADPEVRYMPSGGAVTSIRVATSETWKDQQTGQQQERTEWHRVVFYRRLAEIAAEYLKKGSKVYIEGSLRTSQYEKNGEKRYSTDIIANEMQMLDRAGEPGGARAASGGGYAPSSRGEQDRYAPAQEPSHQSTPSFGGGMDEGFDDDIPF